MSSQCTNPKIEIQYKPCYWIGRSETKMPSCTTLGPGWQDLGISYDCTTSGIQGKRRRCGKATCSEGFTVPEKTRDNIAIGILILTPVISFALIYIYNIYLRKKHNL